MSIDTRIDFYLGELCKYKNEKNSVNINNYSNIKTINDLDETKKVRDYLLKQLLIKTNNTDKKFKFNRADIQHILDIITLCKNRANNTNDGVILRCLNFKRHWGNYYTRPPDIDFDIKINKVFWRGTTTGNIQRKGNRFDLISRWFNINPNIDVGFSKICQDKDDYSKYVKGKCDIPFFLKYKYILSIEGNDKDSGLNWKLNSNSLVMMPRPRAASWLMETTLIPNHHYILLKDDFSNLKKKLNWCNKNPDTCKEIIKNANNYMKQFSDNTRDEQIEETVINTYFDIIKQ